MRKRADHTRAGRDCGSAGGDASAAVNPELPRMRPDRPGRAQFLRHGGGKPKSPMSCARLRRPRLGRAACRIVGACPAAPAQAGRDPETPGVVAGVLRGGRRGSRSAK
jgi:hypothetical protein